MMTKRARRLDVRPNDNVAARASERAPLTIAQLHTKMHTSETESEPEREFLAAAERRRIINAPRACATQEGCQKRGASLGLLRGRAPFRRDDYIACSEAAAAARYKHAKTCNWAKPKSG